MNADETASLSALVTSGGVVLSFLVGVGGIILAARANGIAKAARKDSARALELSEASNAIATEANSISTGANSLAQEANDISRAGRDREAERNDVDWSGNWREPGVYVLSNDGQDTAHKVRATVTVDGTVVTELADAVGNGEKIILRFPEAAATYEHEQREKARAREARSGGPRLSMSMFELGPLYGNDHGIRERITWQTELGLPKLHEAWWSMSSLAPSD